MLKRSDTFVLRKERQFFKSASKEHHKHFSLLWLPNQTRLLQQVIISKGVAQNSVERNAIKRVVKRLLSTLATEHSKVTKSIVVVIKNKKSVEELDIIKTALESIITQR